MAINKKDYIPYSPFKLWTIENFPFIEEDFDAITNYQLYSKIVEVMKKLIENQNKLQQSQNDVIVAFNNLENYVNNYFANLNVQDEIDNKLDEMAESGELVEIIGQYLQLAGVLTFNTIDDLSQASNIIDGSICYVLGQNLYNDGKGAYYKVRQITSGDVVDGFNIVALDVSNILIAERMPNYYINELISEMETLNNSILNLEDAIDNKYNRTDELMLQNYILYDISSSEYSQGSTAGNSKIYIYKTADSVTGDLLVFNNSEQLENTISNVPFEHGNSILYKQNKIYSAISSKKIKVLDLSNNTYSELNPFTSSEFDTYQDIIGLANYDSDNIICLLGYKDTEPYINNINKCLLVILNLTNNNTETIELENTKLYNIDNLAIQNVSYYNNHVYLLCSQPNMILDFIPNGNKYNLNKIYTIPVKDNLGLLIGEVEQLTLYYDGTFMLSSHVKEYNGSSNRTIKTYFLSFDTELAPVYHKFIVEDISVYRTPVYCDSNSTKLYENGSSTYPFKSIVRALEYVNYNKLTDSDQILIANGNYKLGTIYNLKKGSINQTSQSGGINFTGDTKFVNCYLNFGSPNNTMNFNKIEIDGGNINLFGNITSDSIIDISNAKVNLTSLTSTYNVTNSIPVRVRNGSIANIKLTSKVTTEPTFYITDNGVCISNSNSKTITGTGTFIETGSHGADV